MLKFGERFDPSEIQFQPGTWFVRAAAMEALIHARGQEIPLTSPGPEVVPGGGTIGGASETPEPSSQRPTNPVRVHIRVGNIPADKVRDVIKVAILPLAAKGADVVASIDIVATKADGVPRRELDLVVAEGLRQLGLSASIEEGE